MAEETSEKSTDESEASDPITEDNEESVSEDTQESDPADAPADPPAASSEEEVPEPANEPTIGNEIPVVEETRVTSADGAEVTTPITDISMLLDIPVTLSMEIGQTKISISELLKLGKDSVIELQRLAHEPLDVLVNGTLVAHGEAVVVGDRFGIRLTDVISPQERLRKFG